MTLGRAHTHTQELRVRTMNHGGGSVFTGGEEWAQTYQSLLDATEYLGRSVTKAANPSLTLIGFI